MNVSYRKKTASSELSSYLSEYMNLRENDPSICLGRLKTIRQMEVTLRAYCDTVSLREINPAYLTGYENYLRKRNSANTVKKRFTDLKQFFKWLDFEYEIRNKYVNAYRVKGFTPDFVVLNENQIEELLSCKVNHSQSKIRDMFTILLFTGMAWVDYRQLDLNIHCRNGNITKERSKTKTRFCVPMHPRVKEILSRSKPIIADQAFNRQLKNLLRTLPSFKTPVTLQVDTDKYVTEPFYRCVSSHTGRHTFIDRLLRKNVPINIIMGYVGHSSPDQLLSYAVKAGINSNENYINFL